MATYSKLPSGKWRVQIRRSGFYRQASFARKGDAQEWAAKIEAQIYQAKDGGLVRPKGATFAQLVRLYREQVRIDGRTKSACVDRLAARLGHVPLENFSPLHLRDFIDARQKEGAGGVTIAQDLSYLSGILEWARHVRRLDLDPDMARDARRSLKHRRLKTRSNQRERLPSAAELACLRQHWEDNPRQSIPMPLLVDFAVASAMRQGEICRIRAEDVDSELRTVIVRDRKDPRNKSGNDQAVPLVGDAWTIVERQLKRRPAGRLFPYNADSVSAAFTRGCKKCGIKDLRFHDLRHLGTVELFRMGLDIPRVSLITGHKSWENLKRYTNLKPEDVHERVS